MIAVYYLHLFAGNMLIGYVGGLLSTMTAVNFWMLHAGLMAVGVGLLVVVRAAFGHILAPAYNGAIAEN